MLINFLTKLTNIKAKFNLTELKSTSTKSLQSLLITENKTFFAKSSKYKDSDAVYKLFGLSREVRLFVFENSFLDYIHLKNEKSKYENYYNPLTKELKISGYNNTLVKDKAEYFSFTRDNYLDKRLSEIHFYKADCFFFLFYFQGVIKTLHPENSEDYSRIGCSESAVCSYKEKYKHLVKENNRKEKILSHLLAQRLYMSCKSKNEPLFEELYDLCSGIMCNGEFSVDETEEDDERDEKEWR